MQNLAEKSGFPTFDTLYNAVDASDIKWVWNKVAELQAEPSQVSLLDFPWIFVLAKTFFEERTW